MTDDFNPYLKWLGIPLDQQPPNPYQLLGIQPLESDPDVIDNAANRQMAHVRSMQSGPHANLSQKLLTELASARVVLLDPQKKTTLDQQLMQAAQAPPAPKPVAVPVTSAPTPVRATPIKAEPIQAQPIAATPIASATPTARATTRKPAKKQKNIAIEITKVVVGGAVGLGIAYGMLLMAGINPLGKRENVEAVNPSNSNPQNNDPTTQQPVVTEPDPFEPAEVSTDDVTATNSPVDPFEVSLPLAPATDIPASEPARPRVRDMPEYTLQDVSTRQGQLTTACDGAQGMLTTPGNFSDAQKQALSVELTRAIAMYATEFTFCSATTSELDNVVTTAKPALDSVSDTENKRRYLGAVAARSWKTPDAASKGVMLVGEVQSMRLVGSLYETKIQLTDPESTVVPVYSWQDPAGVCRVGTKASCLGVIVDNPSADLTGYEGQDPQVVWTRRFGVIEPAAATPATPPPVPQS